MSGRNVLRVNLLISVIAILGDWTAVGMGVAGQHHKLIHQGRSKSTSGRETVNTAPDDHPELPVLPERQKRQVVDPSWLRFGLGKRKLTSSTLDVSKSNSGRETVNTAANDHPTIKENKRQQRKKEKGIDPTLLMMGIGKRKLGSSTLDVSKSNSGRETVNTAANDHPTIKENKRQQSKKERGIDPTLLMMGIGKRKLGSSTLDVSKSNSGRETVNTAANDHPAIKENKRQQRKKKKGIDPTLLMMGIGKRKLGSSIVEP